MPKTTDKNDKKKEIYKIELFDDKGEGIIQSLKDKGVNVENISERKFEGKLLDTCYKYDIPDLNQYFGDFLKNLFKPTKKDREIKTTMQFFRSNKPNNRGSHISDFRVIVNNQQMPFSSLDQVDYFLTNYIGYVENHNKKNSDPTKIKDPELIKKKFFNKYEKEYSHFPAEVERLFDSEKVEEKETDKNNEKVEAAGAGGKGKKKHRKTKKHVSNEKKIVTKRRNNGKSRKKQQIT